MIAINAMLIVFSAWVASTCRPWSFGWWFNVFASAINAAAVVVHFI